MKETLTLLKTIRTTLLAPSPPKERKLLEVRNANLRISNHFRTEKMSSNCLLNASEETPRGLNGIASLPEIRSLFPMDPLCSNRTKGL